MNATRPLTPNEPNPRQPDRGAFLASEFAPSTPETARFHVIPAPFEASVSYGGGTARGPAAILRASHELEAFDGRGEPGSLGIHTTPPIETDGGAAAVLRRIAAAVGTALDCGAVPVLLGGEHTVTLGAIDALRHAAIPFGVVQFDAHADLRDRYDNNPLSHACVMRRIHEAGIPIFQVGVRSLSKPEFDYRARHAIAHRDAESLADPGAAETVALPTDFPDALYITFDLDALDPSILPATGTPEPGGLEWYATLRVLRQLGTRHRIIGFDVVELAPIPAQHMSEFTAARLVYSLMGLAAGSA